MAVRLGCLGRSRRSDTSIHELACQGEDPTLRAVSLAESDDVLLGGGVGGVEVAHCSSSSGNAEHVFLEASRRHRHLRDLARGHTSRGTERHSGAVVQYDLHHRIPHRSFRSLNEPPRRPRQAAAGRCASAAWLEPFAQTKHHVLTAVPLAPSSVRRGCVIGRYLPASLRLHG